MYDEDQLIQLSALQHFVFCERQCALIHVEQTWADNRLTVEGELLHETVDSGHGEARGDLRIARSLPLRSFRLGLSGKADMVELHRLEGEATRTAGIELDGIEGRWRLFPVEFKRGKPKRDLCDSVQLCAQAMCLEEMLDVDIGEGALFYGRARHRLDVAFDAELRCKTTEVARGVHDLISSGRTPKAVRAPKCKSCSLITKCLPSAGEASARDYLRDALRRK